MTQAFNLSQLANNLNTAGQLDATDGLVNAVPIANGGTGASTNSAARTNLGLGTIATQNSNAVSITGGSISGITDLTVADGGTGASTAADARSNLSVPSNTGTGASGTWEINVTGNAATVTTITTLQVLNATASASVGAVGTYAFLRYTVPISTTVNPGDTLAGSLLNYASMAGTATGFPSVGSAASGTWRLMGYMNNSSVDNPSARFSVFLRIS
jgi:hypothetical protein